MLLVHGVDVRPNHGFDEATLSVAFGVRTFKQGKEGSEGQNRRTLSYIDTYFFAGGTILASATAMGLATSSETIAGFQTIAPDKE